MYLTSMIYGTLNVAHWNLTEYGAYESFKALLQKFFLWDNSNRSKNSPKKIF